jgi:hypothetical protein
MRKSAPVTVPLDSTSSPPTPALAINAAPSGVWSPNGLMMPSRTPGVMMLPLL